MSTFLVKNFLNYTFIPFSDKTKTTTSTPVNFQITQICWTEKKAKVWGVIVSAMAKYFIYAKKHIFC